MKTLIDKHFYTVSVSLLFVLITLLYIYYHQHKTMSTTLPISVPVKTLPVMVGGCQGTQFGCCPDGVTSKSDQNGSNCYQLRLSRNTIRLVTVSHPQISYQLEVVKEHNSVVVQTVSHQNQIRTDPIVQREWLFYQDIFYSHNPIL